jgi:hypothetical protein
MPIDFLSQIAIDAVGIFSDLWKLAQELDEFAIPLKNTCTSTQTTAPVNI